MPPSPLRIAILECDKPLDTTRKELGGHTGLFRRLFSSAAHTLDHPNLNANDGVELSTYDVVDAQEYPSLDSLDAILISGSRYNAFEDELWILKLLDFVKNILDQKSLPLLGVCFGHQIIARAKGAKVGRSEKGWEVSVTPVELTERGQSVFGRKSLVLDYSGLDKDISNDMEQALHLMNRDFVQSCPEGVERLAYTAKCSIHGLYVADRFLTVQSHPEFNEQITKEILTLRNTQHIIDDTTFQDAMTRAGKDHDGVVIAQAFLRFTLNADR